MAMETQQHRFPPELYYESRSRLWMRIEGEIATVGLSALALETFGDIVYVATSKTGALVERGQSIGSIEAAKMVDDLVAPVSGEIVAFNEEVRRNPALINADPYGTGWLLKIKLSAWEQDAAALLHGPTLERWLAEQWGEVKQ